jgi:general secretion pathway protein G
MKLHRNIASRRSRAGFSLAELMVVVVILGLIATIVVPNVLGRFQFSQRETAKINIASLDSAIETYVVENGGTYPESLEILVTPDENGRTYLKNQTTVPVDPWGNPYVYEPPQAGTPAKIISYGKDGQPGGEGDDADIDNFSIRNAPKK